MTRACTLLLLATAVVGGQGCGVDLGSETNAWNSGPGTDWSYIPTLRDSIRITVEGRGRLTGTVPGSVHVVMPTVRVEDAAGGNGFFTGERWASLHYHDAPRFTTPIEGKNLQNFPPTLFGFGSHSEMVLALEFDVEVAREPYGEDWLDSVRVGMTAWDELSRSKGELSVIAYDKDFDFALTMKRK
jgi:hypothetical protein